MNLLEKNTKLTKKIMIALFTLSIFIIGISYIVSQVMIIDYEVDTFTAQTKNSTKENVVATKNLLDDMVADLHNTAIQIEKYDDLYHPEVKKTLEFSQQTDAFDLTFIADAQGNAYDYRGNKFNISDQEYFEDAIEGNVVFSEVIPSQEYDLVQIIAHPIYDNNGNPKGVILGLFDVETIAHLITNVVDFDEHIYIVNSNGDYISCFIDDSSEHKLASNINFWDDLKLGKIHNTSVKEIKEKFAKGEEGDFSYIYDGASRYGCHIPLGIEDWQIVMTVESAKMNSHIATIRDIDARNLLVNLFCLIIMLTSVFIYYKSSNLEITRANKKMHKNNEFMRIAMEYSDDIIFEYDIEEKRVELKTDNRNSLLNDSVLENVPKKFIDDNAVSEESITDLENLFKTIETQDKSEADIQVKLDGEKVWYRVSMHKMYDNQGNIIATIGSAKDITLIKKGEEAIKRKEETYRTLVSNALLYARIDLSNEKVIEVDTQETNISYQKFLKEHILKYVTKEHYFYAAQELSLNTLREECAKGKDYIEVECIMKKDEAEKWVSCLVYRIQTSETPAVSFLIMDIDDKKRKEIALKELAERDGLTGLYNASTTRLKIKEILQSKHSSNEKQILILFDLDNFKQINDTFGHAYGDKVLVDVASTLNNYFRSNDIIGRLGGDEFVIMLCNVRSDLFVDQLLQELCDSLTVTYTQNNISVTISASMGVAIAPKDGTTVDELLTKTDKVLYEVKKDGKNNYKLVE